MHYIILLDFLAFPNDTPEHMGGEFWLPSYGHSASWWFANPSTRGGPQGTQGAHFGGEETQWPDHPGGGGARGAHLWVCGEWLGATWCWCHARFGCCAPPKPVVGVQASPNLGALALCTAHNHLHTRGGTQHQHDPLGPWGGSCLTNSMKNIALELANARDRAGSS